MQKKEFIHGIIAGVLASIAGIIYYHIYYFVNEADFSKIINTYTIIGLNISAGLGLAFLHSILSKWVKKNAELIFNITTSLLSFALILIPISISLPLNIEFPELFPGLTIPMLFFPLLAWFTINPIFSTPKN